MTKNIAGMNRMNKQVTREDVAREAGVSVAAVSRALNNSGYVKKEKKEHIIEVATRMGYNPNPIAMALQKRRSGQLLVLDNDLTGGYASQMFHGAVREAQSRNYQALLNMQYNQPYDFEKIRTMIIDGLILPNEMVAAKYASTVGRTYHLPAVTISYDPCCVFEKPMPCVILDDYKVVNTAVDYLRKKGHRKIGLVTPSKIRYAEKRFRFWKERMKEDQIEHYMDYAVVMETKIRKDAMDDLMFFMNEAEGFEYYNLIEAGRQAARIFMEEKNQATAVLCFNDDLAHGFIQELEELGRRVPEDVSVMGIDGTYIRHYYEKLLTSVATYPQEMGAKCMEILINMLEGKPFKYVNWAKIGIMEGETVADIR